MRFTPSSSSSSTGSSSTSGSALPSQDVSTDTGATRRTNTHDRRLRRRVKQVGIAGMAATAVVGCTVFGISTFGPASAQATAPHSSSGFVGGTLGLSASTSSSDAITISKALEGHVSSATSAAVSPEAARSAARLTLASGSEIADGAAGKVDSTRLTVSLASLKDYRELSPSTILTRVATAQDAAETVATASIAADQKLVTARAAAEAKAAAAARAAAAAKAAAAEAARQAAANTPDGAKATAKALMASQYGWGADQYSCLVSLWTKESGWNYKAYNASGATGIPQALPGSKMSSVAADWSTNATTQVIWGLGYISGSYGTPCAAWSHSQSVNWY